MTDDQVHESLIRWVNSVTGVVTIKAHQGITRPPTPYLMIEKQIVDELTENPFDVKIETLDSLNSEGFQEVKRTPLVELEWLMFIFSFGEGQSGALRKVKQAVYSRQTQESLLVSRLVIHDTGPINSIPEFVDQVHEPRSQMNIMLRGISDDGFVIDTIEETDFEIESV